MQHTTKLVRLFALLAVVGLAALALPLSADAGVRVSVGIGVPVYPPPVVVAPPPAVVYPAPVVRGSATGGVRRSPRERRGILSRILRTPASPLAPSPPSPLAPLVRGMLPSVHAALPGRGTRKGFFFLGWQTELESHSFRCFEVMHIASWTKNRLHWVPFCPRRNANSSPLYCSLVKFATLVFFRSTPLSISPYPEAHAPAVCLGTLMWLGQAP